MARSAVTLGINRCPHPGYPNSRPLVYSRLRDIEAPSMGACYLTEWCPELGHLYDLGTEIETYRDAEELVDKARVLLSDAPRRERLRSAGRRAVLGRHTWAHRFRALFAELNIDASNRLRVAN
jgi:spore maturation protein CgeB